MLCCAFSLQTLIPNYASPWSLHELTRGLFEPTEFPLLESSTGRPFLAGGSSNQRWSPNSTHLWLCIYLLCKYTIIWHTAWQSAPSTPALARGRVDCFCKRFWDSSFWWRDRIGCWMIYKSAKLFPHSIAPSYPELIFCATDGCV